MLLLSSSKLNALANKIINYHICMHMHAHAIRKLSHPNVCSFVGFLSDGKRCMILYEFCSRGSLRMVLMEAQMPLDWTFRLSFALDIAKGMSYLHSKGILHGNLNSNTCVVNYRWNVKITGESLNAKIHWSMFNRTNHSIGQLPSHLAEGWSQLAHIPTLLGIHDIKTFSLRKLLIYRI